MEVWNNHNTKTYPSWNHNNLDFNNTLARLILYIFVSQLAPQAESMPGAGILDKPLSRGRSEVRNAIRAIPPSNQRIRTHIHHTQW